MILSNVPSFFKNGLSERLQFGASVGKGAGFLEAPQQMLLQAQNACSLLQAVYIGKFSKRILLFECSVVHSFSKRERHIKLTVQWHLTVVGHGKVVNYGKGKLAFGEIFRKAFNFSVLENCMVY